MDITSDGGTDSDSAGDGDGQSDGDDSGIRLDVSADSTGDEGGDDGGAPSCKVDDDGGIDGSVPCDDQAPPDSFDPEVEWSWTGPPNLRYTIVAPLVANLTDDNDDGEVDLCDTPDIVVVGSGDLLSPYGSLAVLDGATGALHFQLAANVGRLFTPALGDIDGDGKVEIVTEVAGKGIAAFNNDGSLAWQSDVTWDGAGYDSALALADVDNDGDVEIIAGWKLLDHEGNLLWSVKSPFTEGSIHAPTAADLDGDGSLEILLGNVAYYADGTLMWEADVSHGFPQVANLDDDPGPEVLVTSARGYSLLDADGSVIYKEQNQNGVPNQYVWRVWMRPAAIHDIDGDGYPEFMQSAGSEYTAFERDGSVLWSREVSDGSGIAAGTAFDFLGDGVAEAMYGDESFSRIFDGASGQVLLETDRSSRTLIEYPIVADVDNDGSAEIVVVASDYIDADAPEPVPWTVQVIGDVDDRWIQARRIWNQHTYHVTNVREDGTIPQFEPPNWKTLNTFRVQAQINGGGVCKPVPEG